MIALLANRTGAAAVYARVSWDLRPSGDLDKVNRTRNRDDISLFSGAN